MNVELLIEQHLEFYSLKGGCIDLSASTLVKLPHCWKLHVVAPIMFVRSMIMALPRTSQEDTF